MERTQDSIIDEMIDIMPYRFNENMRPYIKELMDIWANTKLSKLHQPTVISAVCDNPHCHDGIVIAMFGENYRCGICGDKQTDL